MDKESFVEALNEDLQTEYQSIVQYINHIATVTGAEFLSTIAELKIHVSPGTQPRPDLGGANRIPRRFASHDRAHGGSGHGRDALAADLRLEESQLERYRNRFSQAMDLGLADVAEALRPLLEQTQEHVRDLQTALGK